MAAEPLARGLAQPRLEPVPEPHSDLEVSEQDEVRAPAQQRLVLVREPVQGPVERPPARVPVALPVRPAPAPACLRHRRPTAAR